MNGISWFVFYFKLPDGREVDAEITGKTFKECLEDAQKRAAHANAEIVAWVEM
jgi:hypothetical protein